MNEKKISRGDFTRPMVERNTAEILRKTNHTRPIADYVGVHSAATISWGNHIAGLGIPLVPANNGSCLCPECGGFLFLKKISAQFGPKVETLYHPQCKNVPDGPDHGYGPFSKHRTFRQYTKNQKKRDYTVDETETETPKPEPKVETPKPKIPDLVIPDVGVAHENFERLFRLIVVGGVRAVLLEGPAGSGKTSMVPQLVKALSIHHGVTFGLAMVNGNAETEASQIGVFKNPHDGTEKLSAFMKAATDDQPHVCLIDEVDAVQPGNLLTINSPTANRFVVLDGKEIAVNPLTVFIVTANATNGANRVYTGRFPMDGATKSRFLPMFCDYSPTIDKAVCSDATLRNEVVALRKRVNNDPTLARNFSAMVGTRLLIQAAQVGKAFGKTGREAVIETLRLGNSPDALTALGY
jgi:MoxR-like ATPase